MQADSMSRFFSVTVTDNGAPWEVPAGAAWTVRFGAAGMPAGWYDTITEPGGGSHAAVVVSGNTATIEIAEQAISTPGQNILCVLVTDAQGYQIASWPFLLNVQAVPGLKAPEATTYYNALTAQVAQTLANAQAAAASAAQAQQYAESINPAQFATAAQGALADSAVQSINGQTPEAGAVTLTPGNIGAATSEQGEKADSAVQTVNGQKGPNPILTPAIIGAEATWSWSQLSPSKGPTVGQNYSFACKFGRLVLVSISLSLTQSPPAFDRNTILLTGLPAPYNGTYYGLVVQQQTSMGTAVTVDSSGRIKLIMFEKTFTGDDPYLWGFFMYIAK